MSGHLLLFGQDITRPTPAVHAGNGAPYGEIQFPGGVITYRDVPERGQLALADIDEAIAAHAELRAMLADAQAALDVSRPGLGEGSHRDEPGSGDHVRDDAGPGHTEDDLEPLPPLPQRTPAGPPEPGEPIIITRDELLSDWRAAHPGECSCPPGRIDPSCPQHGEPQPGGTIYPQLTEEALAGAVPLESLAPEPEEDEAET